MLDKIDYGLLLVRQDELIDAISEVKAQLKEASMPFRELASELEKNPEFITFSDVPLDYLEYTIDSERSIKYDDQDFPITQTVFDWNSVDVRTIVPLTLELNKLLVELDEIKIKIAESKRIWK
jgi:hypothetical protein